MTVPSSTYRLQLSPEQDFAAATDLVGYLGDLGAGALYCSPLLQPSPGSMHGWVPLKISNRPLSRHARAFPFAWPILPRLKWAVICEQAQVRSTVKRQSSAQC